MIENWQTSSLEDVVKFIDYRGKTPQKTESGMRLITAKNVKMGYLQTEPMEFVDPENYGRWMTRGIPKKGDVLFTTEAPLGNVTQLDTDEKVVFAQRIIILQPKREMLDSTFLKYMLLSNLMQAQIHAKGTGATVQGIKSQLLKKVQIAFPRSLQEQKRIVAIVDQAFEAIDVAIENTKQNLANARELFESYLNHIFTQKGDGWIEKTLQEVSTKFSRGKSKHRPRGDAKLYGGKYPLIQTGDVGNSNHRITNYSQTYNDFGLAQSELWPSGTICIAIVGANVAETSILNFDACFPDSVIGIIVNDEYANK
jgi:type I restriction enzyme, S subunit